MMKGPVTAASYRWVAAYGGKNLPAWVYWKADCPQTDAQFAAWFPAAVRYLLVCRDTTKERTRG